MSAGIVGKDGSGYAKQDVAESRQLVMGYKAVVAAHKSPGNESGINLLSMTAPGGDLPGFVQPNASEIQAARPYMQPGTLKIRSSLRGQLIMFAHFVMVGNQVVFTTDFGTSVLNEIFIIEITPIPANNLMVSDARQFDTGVFSQAVGQATVNVGYSFTASDFLVVIRNNVILDEGVDFTRVINSSGTGSTLTLTVAPSGVADSMRVYGGIFFGNGSVEMFTQLERMQAAIAALAADAAPGFHGDNDLTRYLSMTPTELDRRAFGSSVADLLTRTAVLEVDDVFQIKTATFSNTIASDVAGLRMSGLVIGQAYRLAVNVTATLVGANNAKIVVNHAGAAWTNKTVGLAASGFANTMVADCAFHMTFIATATTVTFDVNTTNASQSVVCSVVLESIKNMAATTQF